MFVVPEIEPDIVRLPFEVVTVQSPVCALGLDSTQWMHSISDVIAEFVMIVRSEDTDDLLTFSTGNIPPDESALQWEYTLP